ncbi:hypothetical protein MAR_019280 [Mya arenaria]|uniref:Uncharacterized protein n=1 Tax=Mya arenaria TaxID=6604 RepID=A0ABY7EH57_MYAAR|nr:hypothetical protein MAR_019280 [Mya arenaria]
MCSSQTSAKYPEDIPDDNGNKGRGSCISSEALTSFPDTLINSFYNHKAHGVPKDEIIHGSC